MDIAVVGHAPCRAVIECQRQRVLADNANGSELDGDARFAVMTVGQQQILLRDVVAGDPEVAGQLGKNPHPFPVPQRPGGVVDGGVLADDGVEELERLMVLQRGVFVANHAQHRVGALDEVARPADHGKTVCHRNAFGTGEERELYHLPIKLGGGDGFLGGGGFIEFGAETVPGDIVDVEHRSLAILHE